MNFEENKTWVIAEAGVNHNGDIELAKKLVDQAAKAGADCVKFQTFCAHRLVTRSAAKADYQIHLTDNKESQFEMIRKLELSGEAHHVIADRCRERSIEFLSTPFDVESLRLLVHEFKVPVVKVPSGEITNAPFLLEVGRTENPIILSTGMSRLGEIEEALGVLAFAYLKLDIRPSRKAFIEAYSYAEGRRLLQERVTLLHCTTEYPAPFEEVNLRVLATLRQAFGLRVGYSDHSPGIAVPLAAVALGARVIEKHFTLDRNLPGPDHPASMEPTEFGEMIRSIRQIEEALGDGIKRCTFSEAKNMAVARKSLVAARPIRQGERLNMGNLTQKRPGNGVSPMDFWEWDGRAASRDFEEDELIQ